MSFADFEASLERCRAELRAMGLPQAYDAHNARCRDDTQPDLFTQRSGIVASPDETPAPGALHLSREAP